MPDVPLFFSAPASMNLAKNKMIMMVAVILALLCRPASAKVFLHNGDCIGMVNFYRVMPGESLIEIARKFDLGFNEIADANPLLDPFVPPSGTDIQLPSAWIIPQLPVQEGIVINLAEMRLYFFAPGDRKRILTFPVSIGEAGKETPLGSFSVIEKLANPVWHVPPSILQERPELRKTVAAGPDNPLGSRALRLSIKDVLIHGTNRPWGQGRRVSHGCLRLYPEDILQLYEAVPVGMKVTIVRQAVKIGIRGSRILAEIHRSDGTDYLAEALALLKGQDILEQVDLLKLKVAIYQKRGVPIDISR
ncbi:murein/chitin-binding peptidoglycan L,D-transpeptidase, YkuD family, LysM domain-containing [Geotalea daltonii FRC-32]|uniref:Murein/chitin-binding peptidoglycan L,D-transpeptidase, YkuD family, LysM domain-containing n=1 Tax=Geotalea daltonii (strain DSM 22248 / JCM 15807 / FRC-32) TaxID=316067 RepID=B9M3R3_GEODF|nr:L,D-transpeptidase family protein [Geotalea daltonii]ACM19556.1 murein/chitin-binding peptidoglycan L,D-transpeptidase, YkuD family, LysM domain-containing [Geotalea daltonii FRC-32]